MLAYCRQNKGLVDVVVVHSLTRFSRNTTDHHGVRALLAKYGVTLRSCTEPVDDTAIGRLVENIGAAVAEFDNTVKAERTVTGMKARLQNGEWAFQAPVGYTQVGSRRQATLIHDPDKALLVQRAFELVASGVHEVTGALDIVTRAGLRGRRGRKLTLHTFRNLLRNPLYAGRIEVKKWGISTRGNFAPLIAEDVFQDVQARLALKKRISTPHRRNSPDFPLRVFVRCGACKTRLTGSFSTGRHGRYPYYSCWKKGCNKVRVRRDDLERQFLDLLSTLRPRPEYFRLFGTVVLDVWNKKREEAQELLRAAEAKVAELQKRRSTLNDTFIYQKAISKTTYEEELGRLEEELQVAHIEANEAKLDEIDVEAVVNFAEHVMMNAGRLWLEFDVDRKQRLQRVLFPDGLEFLDGKFGTVTTNRLFSQLREIRGPAEGLASPAGFEPALGKYFEVTDIPLIASHCVVRMGFPLRPTP